jgi:hypothetical protein
MGISAAAESSITSRELQDSSTPVSIAMEMRELYHVERY